MMTRYILDVLLSAKDCSDLASVAQQANVVRKKVLDQLRSGAIPEDDWTRLQSPLGPDFRLALEEKFHLLMK